MQPSFCPFCKSLTPTDAIFCPTCGKNIKEASQPISLGKQIGVYLLSFLLPPLGLFPGIKYLVGKNPNGKTVGLIAIGLTIIGIAITFYLFNYTMTILNNRFEPVLKQYERLGY